MAQAPAIGVHFARTGDVLYEVEADLGEGKRGVFRWRLPWGALVYLGLFETGDGEYEKPVPRNRRGKFTRQRDQARTAVMRKVRKHPWLKYVGDRSPCIVHANNHRCLAARHDMKLPKAMRAVSMAEKAQRSRREHDRER